MTLSDEQSRYVRLGFLVSQFTVLELWVHGLIWSGIDQDPSHDAKAGRAITERMSFDQLIQLGRRMCGNRVFGDQVDSVLELLERCQKLNVRRNGFVHALWPTDPSQSPMRFRNVVSLFDISEASRLDGAHDSMLETIFEILRLRDDLAHFLDKWMGLDLSNGYAPSMPPDFE